MYLLYDSVFFPIQICLALCFLLSSFVSGFGGSFFVPTLSVVHSIAPSPLLSFAASSASARWPYIFSATVSVCGLCGEKVKLGERKWSKVGAEQLSSPFCNYAILNAFFFAFLNVFYVIFLFFLEK